MGHILQYTEKILHHKNSIFKETSISRNMTHSLFAFLIKYFNIIDTIGTSLMIN